METRLAKCPISLQSSRRPCCDAYYYYHYYTCSTYNNNDRHVLITVNRCYEYCCVVILLYPIGIRLLLLYIVPILSHDRGRSASRAVCFLFGRGRRYNNINTHNCGRGCLTSDRRRREPAEHGIEK